MEPSLFWTKVERIFGEIPNLIRMILEFNGFDTFLALKGYQWGDNQYFFKALEESVTGLADLDDDDNLKMKFRDELKLNNQKMENFKMKLGHKNLIINLCHELQKTNLEEFNAIYTTVQVPDKSRIQTELVVRKQPEEEHGYSREEEEEEQEHEQDHGPIKRVKYESTSEMNGVELQEVASPETNEQIQSIYEIEEDEGSQFLDQEEYYEEVEYQDIDTENGIYSAEQIVKTEADNFEQAECYELTAYDDSLIMHHNRSMDGQKSKKPKHMYTDEFLQTQSQAGRIGTPGRRRPKIQKTYPDTEAGLLERWADLVRQSCEVIVPQELLENFNLGRIDIVKISDNIWEVKCPMCTKKLRLQLTHEGKYVNFKRSNFERHLRIVHYKQILRFKPESDDAETTVEEVHTE